MVSGTKIQRGYQVKNGYARLERKRGGETVSDQSFWKGKNVFVTGHTGFKGSWLCLWLHRLGARVTGYALQPPTDPSLFACCGIGALVRSVTGDVRAREDVTQALVEARPDIVIHMAAQPLVRASYVHPAETYEVNVLGTVNVLEAVRAAVHQGIPVRACINVTTDKCYDNREWIWGYREQDRLGGYDPYSNSKACSELVTAAYRSSYFHPDRHGSHGVALASARAGNVIGGGDFAEDRLVPDVVRALLRREAIRLRRPNSVRPWQHVLEPLGGYLLLAQKLYEHGAAYAQGWNFGPDDSSSETVLSIAESLCAAWGSDIPIIIEDEDDVHEAHMLKLDCSKAKAELGWHPKWNVKQTVQHISDWVRAYEAGCDMQQVCLRQIALYDSV